jgi:hypothetical protein
MLKIQLFVVTEQIRTDSHWFGSLDPDPREEKKLDPDPQHGIKKQ